MCSPNLPVGSYSYSQGLEWAVESGWISSVNDTRNWVEELLRGPLQHQDLVILTRLYRAAAGTRADDFNYYADFMLACRETNELRREERDRALAMASLLNGLPMTSSDNDSALTADDNSFRESVKSALHNTPLAGLAVAAAGWGLSLIHISEPTRPY